MLLAAPTKHLTAKQGNINENIKKNKEHFYDIVMIISYSYIPYLGNLSVTDIDYW